jgi:hypothetical protein
MRDRYEIKRHAISFCRMGEISQALFLNKKLEDFSQMEKETFAEFCRSIGKNWTKNAYTNQLKAITECGYLDGVGRANMEILQNAIG